MVQRSGISSRGKIKTKFQHNYLEVVKNLVPELYVDTDRAIYGMEDDILYTVLGKVLKAAHEPSSIFDISGTPTSSVRQHFITRNEKCHIRPYILDQKLFRGFGKRISDYKNFHDFSGFVLDTVLPNIHMNWPTSTFVEGVSGVLNNADLSSASGCHQHLQDTLSWFYYLNTSGPAGGWDPSAGVHRILSEKAFYGETITPADGIKLLFEFLWKNRELPSVASGTVTRYSEYIPYQFLNASSSDISGIDNFYSSTQSYTSGDLPLKGLHTLVDVWYNQNDESSTTLDDSLALLLTTDTYPTNTIEAGPFTKFLRALSFGFYDSNTLVDDIGNLVDIQRCPPKFLKYLAATIGWNLKTGDVDRWRAQLRHATYLYKSKGTQQCLEDAVALIFPSAGFNPLETFYSTYESFLPRMIYYLLATESWAASSNEYHSSKSLKDAFEANTPAKEQPYIINHIIANKDVNLRFLTDYVLERVQEDTSAIHIGGKVFSATTWTDDAEWKGFAHRGRNVKIPPWENDRFYEETRVTPQQLDAVSSILIAPSSTGGFGLSATVVADFIEYTTASSLNSQILEGSNSKWKFFTSSLEQPPNVAEIISRFDAPAMGLADYWNSKGSALVSEITPSNFTYDLDGGIQMPTSAVIDSVADILREYIPFHAVLRLQAKDVYAEGYSSIDKTLEFGEGIEATVDIGNGGTDYDANIMQNIMTTAYYASSVSTLDFPSSNMVTYTNKPRTTRRRRNLKTLVASPLFKRDGRSMPISRSFVGTSSVPAIHLGVNSSEFIPFGYNMSSGDFFSTTGTASGIWRGGPNETGLEQKYDVALAGQTEAYFYHASSDNTYNQFNPATHYNRSTRGESNASHYAQGVSSTFPIRGTYFPAASGVVTRNNLTTFQAALYGKVVREVASEGTDPFADAATLQNFKFGHDFHLLYRYYVRQMDSHMSYAENFYHRVDTPANRAFQGQFSKRLGGFGLLEHAFGPLVYNSDFSILGPLAAGEYDSSLFSYSGTNNSKTVGDVEECHYIAANEFCKGIEYITKVWETGTTDTYVLSGTGYDDPAYTYKGRFLGDSTSRYRAPEDKLYLMGLEDSAHNISTLVSGVEIILDETNWNENHNKFIAVFNQPNSKFCWEHGHSIPGPRGTAGSISLLTPIAANVQFNTTQGIRFPLVKGKDRFLDSQFKYFPKGWSEGPPKFELTGDLPSFALAGWQFFDVSTYPTKDNRASADKPFGTLSISALSGDAVTWSQGYVPQDNAKYAIAAKCAQQGSWIGASGGVFRANKDESVADFSQKHQVLTRNNLIPNQPYKLSVTAKSDHADCSGYRVVIKNKTHNSAVYTPSGGGTWVGGSGATLPVANRINFPAPQDLTTAQNGWTTCSVTFTPSSVFGVSDDYQISIYPHGPFDSGWKNEFNTILFNSVELETVSSVGEYNNLHPEHEYELTVRVFNPGGISTAANYDLDFRLLSDPVPSIPNSEFYKTTTEANNYFNFTTQTWESGGDTINHAATDDFIASRHTVNFADADLMPGDYGTSGWREIKLRFNTHSSESPNLSSRWIRHGSVLHTPQTPYYLEILAPQKGFNPTVSETTLISTKGVTIDNVSIVDLSMNSTFETYTEDEVKAIYTMFDGFKDGKQSRSWTVASGTGWDPTILSSTTGDIQVSGGSRDGYLERWGGDYSGVSSNDILGAINTIAANTPSGIIYEVSDD